MNNVRHSRRRGYADGPFGQVHYQETAGEHPLVLRHQAPMTSGQFDAVYEPLSALGFRAIGIDLPGFGGSDAPPTPPAIRDYASVVPSVLDHLGVGAADLVGHHTGALVATEVCLHHPERVGRLILNGPLVMRHEERAHYLETTMAREQALEFKADGSHSSERFKGRAGFAPHLPLHRINDYVLWLLTGSGPYWYGHNAAFRYDHGQTLPDLRHPTLILTNTGDVIYSSALAAHALRPDFSLTALPGGCIDVVDELPELWVEAVADFLGEVQPPAGVIRRPVAASSVGE